MNTNYVLISAKERSLESKIFASFEEAQSEMIMQVAEIILENKNNINRERGDLSEVNEKDAFLNIGGTTYNWRIQESEIYLSANSKKIEMECSTGVLIAQGSSNPDYPGIFLFFKASEEDEERTIALIEECSDPNEVRLLVWDDERKNEDYTHKFKVYPDTEIITY